MAEKLNYEELEKRIQELEQAEFDHKKIEESLRESEDRFSKAFYLSPDSISISSIETGRLIDVNQGFEDMFGYKRKDVIGMAVIELGLYEKMSDREKMIEIIKRDGRIRNFETKGRSKSGSTFIGDISSEIIVVNEEKCILTIVHDITERKKAEEKLRESESYNKLLFRDSHIPLIVMDPETNKYIDCNQAAINIYGYKNREEILAKTPLDVSTATQYNGEQSSKAAQKKISEALEKGSSFFEWKHLRPNGEIWDAEVHLMSFKHKNSKLLQFSLLDITGRRQIEAHRRQLDQINKIIISARRLEKMFTSLLDELITIFDCDRAFLVFPVDPDVACYKIPMERTKKEWSGAAVQGMEMPMDQATSTLFQKILESKEPYITGPGAKYDVPKQLVEHFHVKSIISLAVHPIIGKPWLLGMHQCSHGRVWKSEEKELFNDIGRRFADGLSSLLFLQELRQTKNYLSNIINSMPSVLVGVDPEGTVTQWNSEAERATGVSVATALGQPLGQVIPHLSREMEQVHKAMEKRKKLTDSKRARLENGDTRYEDVIIYPLITNGVEGAVIRIDDVTEQVRLEEMMIQSEKMLSVGGLAAGMAHEINNPLAGMIQTANVMANRLTNVDMPANQRAAEEVGVSMDDINAFMEKRGILRMIAAINESGHRVAELVDNMLGFARKSDHSVSSHDPAALLDKILELAATDYDLKKKYDFKMIEIVKEYEDNLPMLPCEGAKIQQVLLNILRNGAQAMQETMGENSNPKPRFILRLSQATQANMLHMEIEDNGPGMDEKTRKRIFEPFFTTKPVGVGTGLGLSVSYFIITENHGGEMSVESTPGSGTKFIILLPLEEKKVSPLENLKKL